MHLSSEALNVAHASLGYTPTPHLRQIPAERGGKVHFEPNATLLNGVWMPTPHNGPESVPRRPGVGQVIGYARVSSTDQHLDRQLEAIGPVDRMFTDQVSGGSRANRTGLGECIAYARSGDVVRVASMDRLARSLVDMRSIVDELIAKGASVEFLKEGQTYSPDHDDALGRLLFNMLASFAEFERALIRERQAEGIALAKAAGKYKGRTAKLTGEQLEQAAAQIAAGVPKAKVARELGVDRGTLYRSLKRV